MNCRKYCDDLPHSISILNSFGMFELKSFDFPKDYVKLKT